MSLRLGDTAPDFTADTTHGPISFHQWLGDSWGILFSHPKDFTPVCTTELGYMAKLKPEFDKRNVKVIGLSVDTVEKHRLWSKDIEETQGAAPNYPMIGDSNLAVAKLYQMLPETAGDSSEGRTAADNQTVRSVYVVGPDKKIKLNISYPMTTGRNFDEVLRVVDSLQLTAAERVSTPVNWKPGEDVIIAGSVSNDEAKKIYPNGWKEPKPYIRIVPQPGTARSAKPTVTYRKEGIALFPVPAERVFRYMSVGDHRHAAFKSHRLVGVPVRRRHDRRRGLQSRRLDISDDDRAPTQSADRNRDAHDRRRVRRGALHALVHAGRRRDEGGFRRRLPYHPWRVGRR